MISKVMFSAVDYKISAHWMYMAPPTKLTWQLLHYIHSICKWNTSKTVIIKTDRYLTLDNKNLFKKLLENILVYIHAKDEKLKQDVEKYRSQRNRNKRAKQNKCVKIFQVRHEGENSFELCTTTNAFKGSYHFRLRVMFDSCFQVANNWVKCTARGRTWII